MVFDVCLDCGKVQQSTGNLRYCCSRCDRVTYHAIIRASRNVDREMSLNSLACKRSCYRMILEDLRTPCDLFISKFEEIEVANV